MALETTDNRKEYAGNGVTTGFSFPYYFLDDADLKVISRNDTTGVESTKIITTHYTVSGAGNEAGGTVTMLVAPVAGTTLVIFRDPAITQGTDFRENDSLPAESTEEAFDRAAMISQRLSERADRTVRLSDGFSPTFDPTLPSDLDDSADKIPLMNDTGTGFAPVADWPDITGVTAGMEAALAAAEAAQAAAELAETHAETAETNAETAETNAETAETNAAASAVLASNWASKTNGQVIATEFSSKAWAVGGTNVTSTAGRGAAKEWATTTGATVDGTDYGAKEHAVGTTVTTGSAKDWAHKVSAAVTAGLYSAKEWALGTLTRGLAAGGSAKDWANYTGGTVDNTEYSAKKYAADSAASAAAAAATLASAFFRDVVFFTSASSPVTISSTHNGKLLVFDSSGGAIAVSLPQISGLTMPFNVTALCSVAGNNITFTRGGTDVFTGGGTTKVLSVANTGFQIAADTDPTPDTWSVLDFGSVGDGTVTTIKMADANVTRAKLASGAVAALAQAASQTSGFTVDPATYDYYPISSASGAVTVTMPSAASHTGRRVTLHKTNSTANNAVTVTGVCTLDFQDEVVSVFSNGSAWVIDRWYIPQRQYTLTLSGPAGWSTTRARGVVYKTADGSWRLKFNFEGTKTSGNAGQVTFSGITFGPTRQSVSGNDNSGGTAPSNVFAEGGASYVQLSFVAAQTDVVCSGDVELGSKPTFAL